MKHPTQDKDYLFDKPRNIRRVLHALYASCALLFVLDFVVHRHTEHPLEGWWGFYPLYGFIGCVVLVLIAKWMRTFLMRDEDYYERDHQNSQAQERVQEHKGGQHDA